VIDWEREWQLCVAILARSMLIFLHMKAAPITAIKRERTRLFLLVLAASAAIGAAYGLLRTPDGSSPGTGILVGIANGVLIAACIGGIEIFLVREGAPLNWLNRLPFIAVLGLKSLVYGGIVAVIITTAPQQHVSFSGRDQGALADRQAQWVTIGFSLVITAAFIVILQAASVVGRRTFRDLILGRYRRPRSERRFFLFVDVVGSTAIAERLGAMATHRFLATVFSTTSEPVAACCGEIYQYVGDEIVVTWTEDEGRPEARPLRCFFEMNAALAARAPEFQARYGIEPELRAALHLGEVIAGEVGEQRRAIVFHGDVMNTASRLEQATRELGVRFIASSDALKVLDPQPDMEIRDLGTIALRGREEPIRANGISLRG
jgi:adenylate cyclase